MRIEFENGGKRLLPVATGLNFHIDQLKITKSEVDTHFFCTNDHFVFGFYFSNSTTIQSPFGFFLSIVFLLWNVCVCVKNGGEKRNGIMYQTHCISISISIINGCTQPGQTLFYYHILKNQITYTNIQFFRSTLYIKRIRIYLNRLSPFPACRLIRTIYMYIYKHI